MTNSKKPSRRRFVQSLGIAGVAGGVVGATCADAGSNSAPPSAHNYFDAVLTPAVYRKAETLSSGGKPALFTSKDTPNNKLNTGKENKNLSNE